MATAPTFLTRLVSSRGLQPEPVATALLTHILRHSAEARGAVRDLASSVHPSGQFADLEFSEQGSLDGGEGRPDIVGVTGTGVALIIEAKFDAGLTKAQSAAGYLGGLAQNGLLLFLVPRDRVAPLWPKLKAGPIGMSAELVAPAHDATMFDTPFISHVRPDGTCVGVVSWEHLLGLLEPALHTTSVAADMAQLTDLVRAHVASEWVPTTNEDLGPRTGRQLHRLRDAMRDASMSVSLGKTRNGTNDSGPARWITNSDGATLFWAGIRIPEWGSLGVSPLWAVVIQRNPVKRKAARDALLPLAGPGGPGVYDIATAALGVPVFAPIGADLPEVRTSIERQLSKVRDLLLASGATSEDQAQDGDAQHPST